MDVEKEAKKLAGLLNALIERAEKDIVVYETSYITYYNTKNYEKHVFSLSEQKLKIYSSSSYRHKCYCVGEVDRGGLEGYFGIQWNISREAYLEAVRAKLEGR